MEPSTSSCLRRPSCLAHLPNRSPVATSNASTSKADTAPPSGAPPTRSGLRSPQTTFPQPVEEDLPQKDLCKLAQQRGAQIGVQYGRRYAEVAASSHERALTATSRVLDLIGNKNQRAFYSAACKGWCFLPVSGVS